MWEANKVVNVCVSIFYIFHQKTNTRWKVKEWKYAVGAQIRAYFLHPALAQDHYKGSQSWLVPKGRASVNVKGMEIKGIKYQSTKVEVWMRYALFYASHNVHSVIGKSNKVGKSSRARVWKEPTLFYNVPTITYPTLCIHLTFTPPSLCIRSTITLP